MTATTHFIDRVRERIGVHVNGERLADALCEAIRTENTGRAQFVSRVDRSGKRIFRFRTADRRTFYALVDTDQMVCITIMPPGFTVGRQSKPRLELE